MNKPKIDRNKIPNSIVNLYKSKPIKVDWKGLEKYQHLLLACYGRKKK